MKKIIFLIWLLEFAVLSNAQVFKSSDSSATDVEIGIIEHLDTYVPDDIYLIDEQEDTVNMKSLINMPTIVCFVYFECPMLCTPLMNGIKEVVEKTDMKIGKDYQILTIGFNTEEPISLAVEKKRNYVESMRNEKDAAIGWRFFVSDSMNIAKATNAFGFRYKKAGTIYLHSATLMFVSPDGKITRYLNGTYFLPFEFKMGIVEASKGKSGPTINRVLQFCYGYDNQAKRYVLDITKVAGSITLIVLLIAFSILVFKKKKIKNI